MPTKNVTPARELCGGDCNHCAAIRNPQVSLAFNTLLNCYGDGVEAILNKIRPNFTVCSNCHIDDFTHIERCAVDKEAQLVAKRCIDAGYCSDPDQPKKRFTLYRNYKEAQEAHEREGVIMSVVWAFTQWLYMDLIEGESRLDYLSRCAKLGILKSAGYAEIKKLQKLIKKEDK